MKLLRNMEVKEQVVSFPFHQTDAGSRFPRE